MAQVISLDDARSRTAPEQCQAITAQGRRCRRKAVGGTGFCSVHLPAEPDRIGPFPAEAVEDVLDFIRRRLTGEYEVDEFGFDRELTERIAPAFKPIADYYWRIEWR